MIPRLIATLACLVVLSCISSFGYAANNAVSIGSGGIIFPDNSVQQKASVLPTCSSGDLLVNNSGSWYCGKVMPVDKGIVSCVGSACSVSACLYGYGDCDGLLATGCEEPLNTTSKCGGCNIACPASTACKTYTCTNSTCISTNVSSGTTCPGGTCDSNGNCVVSFCGDLIINGTEQCDDGNAVSGDGCSATCTIESGFLCSGSPSSCIRVTNEVAWCVIFWPQSISTQAGAITYVYGQIFQPGKTEAAGAYPSINAQLGYGPIGTDPTTQSAGWIYVNAIYSFQVGNDDEYVAQFTAPIAGTHSYVYRFSLDSGASYSYCDLDGPGNGFSFINLGVLTVTP